MELPAGLSPDGDAPQNDQKEHDDAADQHRQVKWLSQDDPQLLSHV